MTVEEQADSLVREHIIQHLEYVGNKPYDNHELLSDKSLQEEYVRHAIITVEKQIELLTPILDRKEIWRDDIDDMKDLMAILEELKSRVK